MLTRKKPLRKRKKGPLSNLGKRLDWLASQIVKYRDDWTCQKCGKHVEGKDAHWAHILPKSSGILMRWDLLNALCLCMHDHLSWAHLNPLEFSEWFKEKFRARDSYLQGQRHKIGKIPVEARKAMIAEFEEKLRELGGKP